MSDPGVTSERPRRGGVRGFSLSLQSKLLIMLLSVSIGSTLAVGAVGFASGTDSLRDAAYDELANVLQSRSLAIEKLMSNIDNSIVLESKGSTTIEATEAFTAGFDQIRAQGADPALQRTVAGYYDSVFVPTLEQRAGIQTTSELFLPTDPAQIYLQAHYTAPFDDFDTAAAVDDAGDGSAWSRAHAEFQPFFRDMAQRYGYEDVMLLDRDGEVVYSVYKGVDLGTNVRTGPYAGSSLAAAYDAAINSNTLDSAVFTDFARYQPSYGVPTAWAVSPVGDGQSVFGALAVQFPISTANDVMTSGGKWVETGLGATGEAYLVGQDHLMRSVSRELLQHPDAYLADATAAGTPPDIAERAVQVAGTVLLQPIKSPSADEALRGQSGTTVETNYLGHEVLTAYAPVRIATADWAIIASVDTSEAFEPVAQFSRSLGITIAAILVVVSLLSLLLAQVFARPVRRLVGAVRQVAGGDLAVEIPVRSRDEFGDLARSFNDMSRTLRVKQELIDEQRVENDRLLHTLMPESVAERFKDGEDTIAQTHDDVAVVYADLDGFDDYALSLTPEAELRDLNDLLRGFDDAAERVGMEKVRMLRDGFLASCGLVVPRVDNVRRTVDFALEMRRVVDRFNTAHGSALQLRAGIDAGVVTSGIIGRTSIAYDMWGDAVDLAGRAQAAVGRPGIYLTGRARDMLADSVPLVEVGTVHSRRGDEPLWEVAPEA